MIYIDIRPLIVFFIVFADFKMSGNFASEIIVVFLIFIIQNVVLSVTIETVSCTNTGKYFRISEFVKLMCTKYPLT